jgi:hypothetical protein
MILLLHGCYLPFLLDGERSPGETDAFDTAECDAPAIPAEIPVSRIIASCGGPVAAFSTIDDGGTLSVMVSIADLDRSSVCAAGERSWSGPAAGVVTLVHGCGLLNNFCTDVIDDPNPIVISTLNAVSGTVTAQATCIDTGDPSDVHPIRAEIEVDAVFENDSHVHLSETIEVHDANLG